MPRTFKTIHYIDFHGDLRTTACGIETSPDYDGVSVFLSGATCPSCASAVQERIDDVLVDLPAPAARRARSTSQVPTYT